SHSPTYTPFPYTTLFRSLDGKYIQTLMAMKEQDYQYYKIYALGEWGSIGNLVYTNWERQDLSDIKGTFDNHFNGLDFGFSSDPRSEEHTSELQSRFDLVC